MSNKDHTKVNQRDEQNHTQSGAGSTKILWMQQDFHLNGSLRSRSHSSPTSAKRRSVQLVECTWTMPFSRYRLTQPPENGFPPHSQWLSQPGFAAIPKTQQPAPCPLTVWNYGQAVELRVRVSLNIATTKMWQWVECSQWRDCYQRKRYRSQCSNKFTPQHTYEL